ncbi:hypothetical protein BFJ72_g3903 [Fusarium proliferatum]|uniref:2EXR domain-containing protein n=1 Tax=Gibberella intermedia TaxID=948311 RepID=A0A420TRL8_GIBIN|nr:hypothetical protein BFJ72_g3903 [Fusarium proliferatum]
MASEFHLFSALPTELRLQVWKYAIQPDLPAAHILRVRVPGSDVPDYPQDTIRFARRRYTHRLLPPPGVGVAVPLRSKYLCGIENDGNLNISSYSIDAGLWTACHESRLTMKKHLSSAPWRYPYFPSWKGYYISGGGLMYITIRYSEDLVILQLDGFDFDKLDEETLHRLQDLRNIGIEYRPDWGIHLYDRNERGDKANAFNKIYLFGETVDKARVWIVDHNMRRKTGAPPCHEKRGQHFWSTENISFHGADRKFSSISIGLGKGVERLAHWEYVNPVADGEYSKSSLHFADRLHEWYETRLGGSIACTGTTLGLLGWDRL